MWIDDNANFKERVGKAVQMTEEKTKVLRSLIPNTIYGENETVV